MANSPGNKLTDLRICVKIDHEYSIIPGFFIVLFSYLFLKYTQMGIWGLIIAQGVCQLAYNNWKWPMVVMKDLKITPYYIIKTGFLQITNKIYRLTTYVRC